MCNIHKYLPIKIYKIHDHVSHYGYPHLYGPLFMENMDVIQIE